MFKQEAARLSEIPLKRPSRPPSASCCSPPCGRQSPGVSQRDVRTIQIETKAILNKSRHHFEGTRGESHPANRSYVFDNTSLSLTLVCRKAEVAGFGGLGKIMSGFGVALLNLGSSTPANVLLAQHSL